MPDLSAQRATMRLSGYSTRVFASFYVGAVVFQGAVAITPTPPTANIIYTASTGDYADILGGYRIDFFSSTGDFKGRTRIRFNSAATSSVIYIRETSAATIEILAGDTFKVYADPRLSDKLTTADANFAPDGITYSDQGSNPPPVACSGGHYAGRVDAGQTYATIQMVGSTSEVADPDSTPGNVSHVWTLPSGVAFQSGSSSTDADPIIEADTGEHLLLHTVTDTDNSKSVTQSVVIMVTDDSTPPHRVAVTSYQATPESGWTFSITVLSGDTDTDAIPDGCLCILWSRERLNNTWQSLRGAASGRAHILAVGIVSRDTSNQKPPGVRRVSFEVISPLERLRQFTGYSKVMEESASPDGWLKLKTLGVKRAIIQMIQYYSTLIESGFDLILDADLLDERYPAFYLQRSTAYDQIVELTTGIDARLICDRSGRFDIHTHPAFIPYADRAAVTETLELADRDILEYSFEREHHDKIEVYRISGFSGGASGNEPYFSLYPGSAPGDAVQTPTRDRLIVDATSPQDDMNERAGRYGALIDNVLLYQNGSSEWVKTRAGTLRLRLRGSYDVFDFYKEYTTIAITNNARGLNFTGHRFYPTDIRVSYAGNGSAVVDLTLQMETNAAAGETFIPPEQYVAPYTPITYTPQPYAPPSYTGRIPLYTSDTLPTKMFLLDRGGANASIATAWSPSLSSLTYTDISTGLSGIGVWACSDPYDYRRRFALTADGLYRCDNIWSFSTWTQVADNATLYGDAARIGTFVGMSINRKGYIYITSGTNAFIYTTDYGATWNRVSVDGGALTYYTSLPSGNESHLVALVSSHNSLTAGNGVLYATTGTMYFGVGNTFRLRKSTDWGATWAAIADRDDFGFPTNMTNPCNLHIPHTRSDGTPNVNDSSQELYLLQDTGSAGYLARSTNAGLSGSAVNHAGGATSHTGWQMMSFTHDGAKIAFAQRAHGLNTSAGIIISDDSGAGEIRHSHLFAQGDNYICLNGFSNHSQAWLLWCQVSGNGGDAKIVWTVDDGANYQSVATPSTFTGTIKLPAYVEWDLSDFIAAA